MLFPQGRSGNSLSLLVAGEICATNHQESLLTTVGDGTVLAAMVAGGIIRRSGPVGAYADTFPTAESLRLALNSPPRGSAFLFFYNNTVAQAMTFTAALGIVTLGTVNVAASVCRVYNVKVVNDTPQVTINATTTNGSPSLTNLSPTSLQGVSVGMAISGTGIPAASFVKSLNVAAGTLVVGTAAGVDANATATADNIAITFSPVIQFHGLGSLATP